MLFLILTSCGRVAFDPTGDAPAGDGASARCEVAALYVAERSP